MLARRLVALGLTALTALVGAVQPTAAAPDTVPVTFEVTDLRPGETRTHDVAVHVRGTGTVTDVDLAAQGAADLTWDAALCDASGACVPFDDDLVGTTLAGGTWTVAVTVTAGPGLQQGDRSQVVGHLSVQGAQVEPSPGGTGAGQAGDATGGAATGAGGTASGTGGGTASGTGGGTATGRTAPLAMTGAPLPAWLALALTTTAAGAWLVVLGRRRRDDESTTQEGAQP